MKQQTEKRPSMFISGFSLCRNGIKYDYPVVEAIESALPLVDEFVINVGQSDDGTLELIRSIRSPKIRIVESYWDDSLKKDGLLFSKETNVALAECRGDWAFYIQADEVLHEDDYPAIEKALETYHPDPAVLAFVFRYHHFYGDYWSVNPWGYHRAVRLIRNNGSVESCGDAVGFSLKTDGNYLQLPHPAVRQLDATVYHYGWVKPGAILLDKFRYQIPLYHGEAPPPDQARLLQQQTYDFPDYDVMKEFRGSHPAVMSERIARSRRLAPRRNRWLNPRFYRQLLQKGFRG